MKDRSTMEQHELDDKLARRQQRWARARAKSGGARRLALAACALLILVAVAASPVSRDGVAPSGKTPSPGK